MTGWLVARICAGNIKASGSALTVIWLCGGLVVCRCHLHWDTFKELAGIWVWTSRYFRILKFRCLSPTLSIVRGGVFINVFGITLFLCHLPPRRWHKYWWFINICYKYWRKSKIWLFSSKRRIFWPFRGIFDHKHDVLDKINHQFSYSSHRTDPSWQQNRINILVYIF